MNRFNRYFAAFAVLLILWNCRPTAKNKAASSWNTYSPDSSLQFVCNLQNGKLSYMLFSDADTLIYPSVLGLKTDKEDFTSNLSFIKSSSQSIKDSYELTTGKRLSNTYEANEINITFANAQSTNFSIIARLSNDGLGFKYAIAEYKDTLRIVDELTTFAVDKNSKSWLTTHDIPTDWGPAYEAYFSNGEKVGNPAKDTSGYTFPMLFESKSKWLLITEANLKPNYFAAHIQQNCEGGIYKIRQPEQGEGLGTGSKDAITVAPFDSPWRTIIVGKSVAKVVESNLVFDLSDANKIGDVSWVKPGRASWNWWGEHDGSTKFSSLKNFVDLAKEFNWEYSLVDANWDKMTDGGTIEDLTKYAQSQNIGLSLWYNSGGPHNKVTERPREIMSDPIKRKEELKKLNEWGVKAVKIDFFQSDKQNVIQLYHDILVDAAAAKIMVVFHGCTLPKGWARTYPNLVSMEAIKGAEQYGWSKDFPPLAPWHNTVVPFTRNVVGSMDYTPITFSSYEGKEHTTTNAHELALGVIFESGILHFADRAYSYRAMDKKVKEYMSIIPVAWDDTKLLDGYPGKYCVMARKNKESWFVAGINGEKTEKALSLTFDFLDKNSTYLIKILKDGTKPSEIEVIEKEFTTTVPFDITMMANGGFSAYLKKK
jgi:hypothetical protein